MRHRYFPDRRLPKSVSFRQPFQIAVQWLACLAILLSYASLSTAQSELREWSDSSGKFKVEAKLKSVEGESIELEKPDGRIISVPLSRLSSSDRDYVIKMQKSKSTASRTEQNKSKPSSSDEDDQDFSKRWKPGITEGSFNEISKALEQNYRISIRLNFDPRRSSVSEQDKLTLKKQYASLEEALDTILSPLELDWRLEERVVIVAGKGNGSLFLTRVYRTTTDVGAVIQRLIKQVEPKSWDVGGGMGAAMPWMPNMIVVHQSASVHRKIQSMKDLAMQVVEPPKSVKSQSDPLDKVLSVNFNTIPLRSFLKQIGEDAQITIRMDNEDLEESGVSPDSPVTVVSNSIRLENLLELVLNPMELVFVQEKDSILVTTRHSKRALSTVEYSFGNPNGSLFVNLVTHVIDSGSWEQNGGLATIEITGPGKAKIKQTRAAHAQIKQLLATLDNSQSADRNKRKK